MSRKRVERGILGLPKKKSVLFSFNARDGEEFPSDSEDSDYFPGRRSTDEDDESAMLEKAKKRLKKKRALNKSDEAGPSPKKTRLKSTKETKSSLSGLKVQINLPPELLLKVFQYCVASEGVSSVLPKLSRVCRSWHALSQDAALLKRLDLNRENVALTKKRLDLLLEKDLSLCEYLNLSGQTKLQSNHIASLLREMPQLISLDLSDCANVKSDLVGKEIPAHCPLLERVDISSSRDLNLDVSPNALKSLITSCGPRLRELRITKSGCIMIQTVTKDLFKVLSENCPNLEELDMRMQETACKTVRSWEVGMEAFKKGCPLMKEIRVDGFHFVEADPDSVQDDSSAPCLKNLKFYSQSGHVSSNQTGTFYRMFNGVEHLKELSISSSNLLPSLITSQVKVVDALHMSGMLWKDYEYTNLIECVDAWGKSLRHLDISRNIFTNSIIDTALCHFSNMEAPLLTLNLSATNVTPLGVINVIQACKQLQAIDLTSCREMPRGSKRIFTQKEFKSLLRTLNDELDSGSEDD